MKNLDTHTVLAIIEMIDTQIHNLEQDENIWQEELHFGVKHLSFLSQHLQSYVDSELNEAENQTVE